MSISKGYELEDYNELLNAIENETESEDGESSHLFEEEIQDIMQSIKSDLMDNFGYEAEDLSEMTVEELIKEQDAVHDVANVDPNEELYDGSHVYDW